MLASEADRRCQALIDGLEEIALSTNGHLLAELAAPLRAAGVDRLNVSLDSLDPAKFRRVTRGGRARSGGVDRDPVVYMQDTMWPYEDKFLDYIEASGSVKEKPRQPFTGQSRRTAESFSLCVSRAY